MGYQCRDCSYRGNKVTSAGSCPACGSFAVSRGTGGVQKEEPRPRTLQLALLVALWGAFAGLVLLRLVS